MTSSTEKPSTLALMKKVEEAAVACNRCGFCTSYCPTYAATGSEVLSPRGRNQMFRALLENKVHHVQEADRAIQTCLLCGECTSICFSEVPTADLMVLARDYIRREQGGDKHLRLFFKYVLMRPLVLGSLLHAAFALKKLGVLWALEVSGLLPRFAPALSAMDRLVKKVPLRFLQENHRLWPYLEQTFERVERRVVKARIQVGRANNDLKPVKQKLLTLAGRTIKRPSVAYMPVCGSQYLRPSIGLATFSLLKEMGVQAIVPKVLCCGLPAASVGVLRDAREIAKENIVSLERGKYDSILADDSSCTAHLKDYPKYFMGDPEWVSRAEVLTSKVRELSGFLVGHGLQEILKKKPWGGLPIAYHDPCKAQYSQKSVNPPRVLLLSIPNLKLLPVPEADQCCGGGGSYSFTHPDLSKRVLRSKIDNIISTGAGIVVTSSTSCLIQLASGLHERNSKIEVLHLSEFLHRALSKGR